jgi:hypothetical protein
MAAQPQPVRTVYRYPQASRLLMIAGFACFVIAALIAGGVLHGPDLAWVFGGFAAWSASWAL